MSVQDPLEQSQEISTLRKVFVLRDFYAKVHNQPQATRCVAGETVEIPYHEAREARADRRVRSWREGDPEPLSASQRQLREMQREEDAKKRSLESMSQQPVDRQLEVIKQAVSEGVREGVRMALEAITDPQPSRKKAG